MNYDRDFVVHVPTREQCIAVQKRFFHDGIPWLSGDKTFRSNIIAVYGDESCIRFDTRNKVIYYGSFHYYESCLYTIISATDFLGLNSNQAMFLKPRR